jgi:uncharacterized protein YfbU (UPF0304 family)
MRPKTERFELRLDEDILSRIDKWRGQQGDVPTRAEAMRRLVESGLARTSSDTIKLSDGERLIAAMLCEIYKHFEIDKTSDISSDFVADVLHGGHSWGLQWKMRGLFHGLEDDPRNVDVVANALEMWNTIERGYERLSKKEKALVQKSAAPFGRDVRFKGFDGNNEAELRGIGEFLVEKLGRFARFKGRELSASRPTLEAQKRMWRVFEPIRATMVGDDLTAAEIIAILRAMDRDSAAGSP